MKIRGILIFAMVIMLTFCGTVAAHPGHSTEYPEEINITTPDPTPGSTPDQSGNGGTIKSSTTSKSNTAGKSSESKEDDSVQTENSINKDDNDTKIQPVEEINDTEDNNESVTNSGDLKSFYWEIALAVVVIVALFVAGFLIRGKLHGR
ncbi:MULTISPECIES: hypothetical protein [Methanobacterium]|jgi:cobalamin biosynthesis Mg chelatase CobN|uniref:Uncharacterized protein n=1 Tax=Methanobacterium veterum TaxID=408577 RepID=A0A9E5A1L2_9EURY|nr:MULTISPECIES: hypothetical protein [Methanobacterium]MCZ3367149.1 hypothetical protein [Methanobacterium veterum]MCZ3373703.1 hypothetical protein [Methanobacterium veterum]